MNKHSGSALSFLQNVKLLSIFLLTVLLIVNFFAAGFALVPGGAARYVLSHGTLSDVPAGYTAVSGTDPVPTGHNADGLGDRVSDFGLLCSNHFSNIGSGFGGIICVEAGTPLTPASLSRAAGKSISPLTDLRGIPTNDTGYYRVEVQCADKPRTCLLVVTDTTVPHITASEKQLWKGDEPSAEDFILESSDNTALEYYFTKKPSCRRDGTTEFEVAAKDRGGNVTTAPLVCSVMTDTEPPVISCSDVRTVFIGSPVMYKDGVTVTDNRDGANASLDVDISAVNASAEGTYPVIYTATDSTGLTSTATVNFTFKYSDETLITNQVEELLKPILDKIIKDGMTDREKAKAIYEWVKYSINYAGTSNKNSWYECALEGLTTRNGDCYTYFSLSKAMLTSVGIENIDVVRAYTDKRPNEHHYWNMVKIDGNWYHFDATPRYNDPIDFFLVTSDFVLRFSSQHRDSHIFDPADYPATP